MGEGPAASDAVDAAGIVVVDALTEGCFAGVGSFGVLPEATGQPATLVLESDLSRNELDLGPEPEAFTYCRALQNDPLHVVVPAGRSVRVFLGHDQRARDANRGWLPTGQHASDIFEQYVEGLMALIGKTKADFDGALHTNPAEPVELLVPPPPTEVVPRATRLG